MDQIREILKNHEKCTSFSEIAIKSRETNETPSLNSRYSTLNTIHSILTPRSNNRARIKMVSFYRWKVTS